MSEKLPPFNELSKKLADFYQVDDYHKLVAAQSAHIEKLQKKLRELQPAQDLSPRPVRA